MLMVAPSWVVDKYHYVVIMKHGIPFYADQNFHANNEYYNWDTLENRVADVDAVIRYLVHQPWVDPSRIVVIGHSEGAVVAAKIAATNRRVTHVACLGVNGFTQMYDFIVSVRMQVAAGKLTTEDGEKQINELQQQFKKIFADPDSITKFWQGVTYKRWHSYFMESSTEDLLKAEIPVFIAIGTDDMIESADITPLEFLRHGKSNLVYRVLPYADHGFFVTHTEPDGHTVRLSQQRAVVDEVLLWVENPASIAAIGERPANRIFQKLGPNNSTEPEAHRTN